MLPDPLPARQPVNASRSEHVTPAPPTRTKMSTKLDIPVLAGVLNAPNINSWLNLCQDSFEVHAAINSTTLKPAIQIVLCGLKMEAPAAKSWWNESRDELKALTSWDEFAKRVKERFIPANWKMDALALFYAMSQGSLSFMDYASSLQDARNALSSGGTGFTISDSIFKNHLLFFSHPILCLRIRSMPSFNYVNTRVDALIALMSSTWDSMLLERVIRPPLSTASMNVPKPAHSAKPFILLTDRERDALRLANGCFRCRRTPASPGWVKHGSRDCPGDEANGISPAPARAVAAVVGAEDDSEDEDDFVAAVFPSRSCVLGNGSFSEGEEEANDYGY